MPARRWQPRPRGRLRTRSLRSEPRRRGQQASHAILQATVDHDLPDLEAAIRRLDHQLTDPATDNDH
jgi:hypothetical protein